MRKLENMRLRMPFRHGFSGHSVELLQGFVQVEQQRFVLDFCYCTVSAADSTAAASRS
jgi:hypothetical protein